MKIIEAISAIEIFAAPELQEGYDNAGLITGNSQWECTGILCTLDVTVEVISEATEKKLNLIIAHHPIIFQGLKKINGKNYVEKVIIEAIKHDIAIYAAHTNLDNVVLGVNGMIAKKMQLQNCTILQPKEKVLRRLITFAPNDKAADLRNSLFAAGAGKIGKYSECSFNSEGIGTFKAEEGADPFVGEIGKQHQEKESKIEIVYPFYLEKQVVNALIDNHPYEEVAYDIFTMENVHFGIGAGILGELEQQMEEANFLQFVKDVFQVPAIRHTKYIGRPVKKVAICGGAGSFLLKRAISSGADVFLTADMKYHEFFDAEGKILIMDLGHYESEQFTVDLLHQLLVTKFPTFAIQKTSVNTNPVHYFI
ncbi:MAG TPA: Nif3-like dinuclear metal center hexameric protein [Flavisolibacter sp.]|nr:Nif3-like dinuclear metal center hexameric protein [Flavisolibacter sp.]